MSTNAGQESFFQNYRWPLHVGALLGLSIIAQGFIVYYATSSDAPHPLSGYYEKSLQWDRDQAVEAASAQLGWKVEIALPAGPEVVDGMARPIDVHLVDGAGNPVTGLSAELYALRPADTRLNVKARLVELPHAPGHYRTVVLLGAPGLWELGIDGKLGAARYIHHERVMVPEGRS
ncbi:FixH family protein [Myxococcota bacterium]|nr:FixH family protein [Myxococcota bacterium]